MWVAWMSWVIRARYYCWGLVNLHLTSLLAWFIIFDLILFKMIDLNLTINGLIRGRRRPKIGLFPPRTLITLNHWLFLFFMIEFINDNVV